MEGEDGGSNSSKGAVGMGNISDDDAKRDAQRDKARLYEQRSEAKMRKLSQSKGAKADLFRRGRRLPGSAYSRRG